MLLIAVSLIKAVATTTINGVYITCDHETENIKTFKSLITLENGNLNIATVYKNCKKSLPIKAKIFEQHQNHIDALEVCVKNSWNPCVIFESDVVWDGSITEKIEEATKDLKNEDWSLLLLGFNPIQYRVAQRKNGWKIRKVKTHTVQLEGTVGGCHAYMVRNSTLMHTLLKYRGVLDPRGYSFRSPCIEFWSTPYLKVFLSLDAMALQKNKKSDEGMKWYYNKFDDTFYVQSEPPTKIIGRLFESHWQNIVCAFLLLCFVAFLLKGKHPFCSTAFFKSRWSNQCHCCSFDILFK